MKKIMFNDKYGLTEAVLKGNKTQTRRIIPNKDFIARHWNPSLNMPHCYFKDYRGLCQLINSESEKVIIPKYQIGEVVAIAQSYYNAFGDVETGSKYYHLLKEPIVNGHKGNYNKMFVKAELMPHQIKITGIRIESLQDISDEDCLKEGIIYIPAIEMYYFERKDKEEEFYFGTPREAYASLIDKVSGKGTWESNPFVFVYDFELL